MADPSPTSAETPTPAPLDEQAVLTSDARDRLEQFRRTHDTKVLTIFFSDLVGSTQLQVDVGNVRCAQLVHRHFTIMRETLAQFDGSEISTAGDSMLMVFATPSEAVKFAILAQRAMQQERSSEPLLPQMRSGIHQGQVVLQKDEHRPGIVDVYGVQVSMAARIMGLAHAAQILMSRAVFDDARTILRDDDFPAGTSLAWINHGPYRFKGINEDCDLCEAGQRGVAPLTRPAAGSKGWPVHPSGQTDTDSSSTTDRHKGQTSKRKNSVVAAIVISLLALAGIAAYALFGNNPSADELRRAELQQRLAEVETKLSKLSGLDDELQGLRELEKKYQEATEAIFSSKPDQVKSEALQYLARLRTYDLSDSERAIVSKADAQAAKTLVLYPEELYPHVRELAETMSARKKQLKVEQERLRSEIVELRN